MKYLSLFSGIGGFEVAIHKVFPDAECIGYSEVDKNAIKVYEHHFPDHINLGDIKKITKETILKVIKNGCDLIVGGFPCKNLSSLSRIRGNSDGIEGPQSGLFFEMLRIINIAQQTCPNVKFVFENNASMSRKNRELIHKTISENTVTPVYETMLNGASFGVQIRKRIFWTNFHIDLPTDEDCTQVWNDVLDPIDQNRQPISKVYIDCMNRQYKGASCGSLRVALVPYKGLYQFKSFQDDTFRSRWQVSFHSDTTDGSHQLAYSYPVGKSRPVTCSLGSHNILIDRRGCSGNLCIPRALRFEEIERLFGYETGYTAVLESKTHKRIALGNTVIVPVIVHVVKHI